MLYFPLTLIELLVHIDGAGQFELAFFVRHMDDVVKHESLGAGQPREVITSVPEVTTNSVIFIIHRRGGGRFLVSSQFN